MKEFWNKKILDTKAKGETISKKEMYFGYLVGPALMYLMTTALSGTYLMQFYTDVIGVSGALIVAMPVISKILLVVMNIFFSDRIAKTQTAQGKARPWLLVSGVLLPLAGILLYAVPKASYRIQMLWILFSYNFFFVIIYNIYILSHSMMIPRSSRNSEERDRLTLFKNISEAMIPGTLSAVIMPFIIRAIGVGETAKDSWFMFMLGLSIIALPAALIEYFYTKERVTEKNKSLSIFSQLKESLKYKEWLIVIALIGLKYLESSFMTSTMIYYCNWVLADSVANGARAQALFNVIGQFPLGIGVFLLWPLIRKFGKYRVMKAGFLIAMLGNTIVFMNPQDLIPVLIGMFIRSIGSIPSMMSVALMSDVLDKTEAQSGYRFDALGASLNSVMHNLALGISQSTVLLCINTLGYIAPENAAQIITQPAVFRSAMNFCIAGISILCYAFSFVLISQLDIKKKGS